MSETIMKNKEMETSIPTLDIDFDQYDSKNIDVWEKYIPIGNEKERLTMAVRMLLFLILLKVKKDRVKHY